MEVVYRSVVWKLNHLAVSESPRVGYLRLFCVYLREFVCVYAAQVAAAAAAVASETLQLAQRLTLTA